MKKKTIISIAAAVVAVAAVILIVFAAKNGGKTEETAKPAVQSEEAQVAEDTKIYTPTFMYFVSNSDNGFEATNNMIEELKREYEGRVNFEVINLDDVPEAKENYPVDQQTPALIMLNTHNDISAIEFKCSDKQKLSKYIENALQ